MAITFLAPVTALLYLVATGLQLLHNSQRRTRVDGGVYALALAALLGHAAVVWQSVYIDHSLHIGFYKAWALVFLVINLLYAAALTRRPLQNLMLPLFPLSALAVLVSTFGPNTSHGESGLSAGIIFHIASSILAYALLSLAAVQAMLLSIQEHQLKHRHTRGIVQILPPLQLMERMLFEMIWVGVILLSLAIISGIVFVDNLFAQHLVHKTVFTLAAWLMFVLLLWGRYQLGWRSQTAARLTFAGFALLLLGFFGSKLVLELVLNR